MPLTLKGFNVTSKRPFGGVNDVYVFSDGIFSGTDTLPRTSTILSYSTIYLAMYDRTYGRLWLFTSNGVGYYDRVTQNVVIVDNTHTSMLNDGAGMVFMGNYVVLNTGTERRHPVCVYIRDVPEYLYDFTGLSGSYSGKTITQTYYKDEYLVVTSGGNAKTRVYDITTGQVAFDAFNTNYHGAINFGNLIAIFCENGGNNFYLIDKDNNSTQVFSGSNYNIQHIQFGDSGLIDKVKPTDFEYDKLGVHGTRGNGNYYIVAHDKTIYKSGSGATITATFMKYNDTYSVGVGTDGGTYTGLRLYNKSTYAVSHINTGVEKGLVSITGSGNLCHNTAGIYDTLGTALYTNSNFITAFSKKLFEG